jgi:hypothetical protein
MPKKIKKSEPWFVGASAANVEAAKIASEMNGKKPKNRMRWVSTRRGKLLVPDKVKPKFLAALAMEYDHDVGYPKRSNSLGVNKRQIKAAAQSLVDAGIPTQFDKKGRCIVESRQHQVEICKHMGFVNYDGGYRDSCLEVEPPDLEQFLPPD